MAKRALVMQPVTRGERLIANYKTVKGAIQLVLGGILFIIVLGRWVPSVHDMVADLCHHVSRAWSIAVAKAIIRSLTPRGATVTGLALFLDGLFTSLEGWALRRNPRWGRWIVVVTTSSFLPFELVAFARSRRLSELAAFVVNLAIVLYLARRAIGRGVTRALPIRS